MPSTGWAGPLRIDDSIAFDIPPQPLLTALRTYSEITGQAVLVDNTLAEDRQSPGVHGSFNKTDALQKLLAGTGLVAMYSSDQAFTLKRAEPDATVGRTVRDIPESLGVEESEVVIEHYAGKIQKPIEAALCQSDDTRPGTYRLAMQIWIASSGHIEKAKLLSPIDSQRDYALHHALNRLVLEPPPPGMPQPMTLLLLPEHANDASVCATALPAAH
ncbi:STN domain-containing protein [Dyella nitratireducens]|uniref:TonB-dependent outer membrane receptor n=1 Tax=Dyella nitratireducens TaxID=1849580 RepID=A0ABQ1FXV2_9GAMM|nr:STN domain-containing protein [Dyella nitratireducens]GGA31899.1 TonB-dependent outer membrane receptor [Dyella nitratireducens]GLQ42809.1 TonB-dependent outer membrane receptor [Dyella nitratireducens]